MQKITRNYKTFKFVLSKAVSETGNTTPLYMHFRYNNGGSQASYTANQHTYRMFGKYTYGASGDTGENSGSNLQGELRIMWAVSQNTHSNKYTGSVMLTIPNMESTDSMKNVWFESFGHYYNGTEHMQFNVGGGTCRAETQAFNGFEIYGSYNWRGYYTVYGMK